MQLNRRYSDILWGPIVRVERKKSSCLSEAGSTLLVNICVKPNEQNQACLSYAMAGKYLTLLNEDYYGA
ncbi:hypothetical protein SAMN05216357_1269 [Porphyromonadaceae bacterium KH3CP3RA]|nr:hypothetical protein SAMN05216357_1269 [Porphyromonadaceae bacterium KH3CP3RA]